jgi:agmatine deiminase
MWDGFGTVMSSELILDENSSLTETQINTLTTQYWGTSRYIKFDNLPYDGIHHIDMHMKLLDEETILVGEYPPGISDGPQIEANLQYLLTNFNTCYGTPYKVVRIPMPSNLAGTSWPSTGAYYRTYTNGVFVNKTYIYPTYYEKYDTTAARIYSEALPGYKLVGIDCDPDPISASGAIHCITSNIGIEDPLLISHKSLEDTDVLGPYTVNALVKHRTGITSATLYHTSDTAAGFTGVPMTLTVPANNTWTGYIPAYPAGTTVFYYIGASATSGKTQVRPITAPDGWWKFDISVVAGLPKEPVAAELNMGNPYPNPARAITCIPVESNTSINATVGMYDVNGRLVNSLFSGELKPGTNNMFFNAMDYASGVYYIKLDTEAGMQMKKVIVYGY